MSLEINNAMLDCYRKLSISGGRKIYVLTTLSVLLLLFTNYLNAQVIPAESSKLNHLITGFSVPLKDKIFKYRLEIAEGVYTNEKEFSKKIIIQRQDKSNQIVARLPEFGKHYTWRIKYLNKKGKTKEKSQLFHFSTAAGPEVDSSKYRLRILSSSNVDTNLLILTDNKAVIYDVKGNPVWFWPGLGDEQVRDFKPTTEGTFTLMTFRHLYEIDYDGRVLWTRNTSAGEDSTQRFHHELTKLPNGNFMVCGHVFGYKEVPAPTDSIGLRSRILVRQDGKYYRRNLAGTLIELDEKGNEVWRWSSAPVIPDTVIYAHMKVGRPDALLPAGGTHMNGFYFSKADSMIYISFRNINTILKIKYPSGAFITSYGQYKDGNFIPSAATDTPFYHQHNPTLTSNKELLMFDNNTSIQRTAASKIALFKESDKHKGELHKIWEFNCDIDTNTKAGSISGGSVYELPDENFLACTGETSRILMVTRNKEVIWNALSEKTDDNGKWINQYQYRTNYLFFNQLHRFLFRGKE